MEQPQQVFSDLMPKAGSDRLQIITPGQKYMSGHFDSF